MKKLFSLIIFTTLLLLINNLSGHIRKQTSLFNEFAQGQMDQKTPLVCFEKRINKLDSQVFSISSAEQFSTIVLQNSFHKPVIFVLYASGDKGSQEIRPIILSLADMYDQKVLFALLNVTKNTNLFLQILMAHNLVKFDSPLHAKTAFQLPLIIFYKNGDPLLPLLQGFQQQKYLSWVINQKFFNTNTKTEIPRQFSASQFLKIDR
jgi:thiol-disulfide isomerase/thioredoxin